MKEQELYADMNWWVELKTCGGVWRHSGDPRAPHVVLRSGQHSDLYIDVLRALSKTEFLILAAQTLATRIRGVIGDDPIDWVVGSPMAAIQLAAHVGSPINSRYVGYTEKTGGSDNKELVCRFDIAPGETVLQVDEMTTTGETPERSIEAVEKKNPSAIILPVVGAFLIRCEERPDALTGGRYLAPVINLPALGISGSEWSPNHCPLCAAGSRAILNPKLVWRDLLRTMANPTFEVHSAILAPKESRG